MQSTGAVGSLGKVNRSKERMSRGYRMITSDSRAWPRFVGDRLNDGNQTGAPNGFWHSLAKIVAGVCDLVVLHIFCVRCAGPKQ